MENEKKYTINNYRRQAIKAARELFYPISVIDKIKNAETICEIDMILSKERNK